MARKSSNKKKRGIKKPRNINAITAIVHCKGGSHANKRDKQDGSWKKDLDEQDDLLIIWTNSDEE